MKLKTAADLAIILTLSTFIGALLFLALPPRQAPVCQCPCKTLEWEVVPEDKPAAKLYF